MKIIGHNQTQYKSQKVQKICSKKFLFPFYSPATHFPSLDATIISIFVCVLVIFLAYKSIPLYFFLYLYIFKTLHRQMLAYCILWLQLTPLPLIIDPRDHSTIVHLELPHLLARQYSLLVILRLFSVFVFTDSAMCFSLKYISWYMYVFSNFQDSKNFLMTLMNLQKRIQLK